MVPVRPYFSDPAKSTSYNFEMVIVSSGLFKSYDSIVNANIVWLLDDISFKLCAATILFFEPNRNNSMASSAV